MSKYFLSTQQLKLCGDMAALSGASLHLDGRRSRPLQRLNAPSALNTGLKNEPLSAVAGECAEEGLARIRTRNLSLRARGPRPALRRKMHMSIRTPALPLACCPARSCRTRARSSRQQLRLSRPGLDRDHSAADQPKAARSPLLEDKLPCRTLKLNPCTAKPTLQRSSPSCPPRRCKARYSGDRCDGRCRARTLVLSATITASCSKDSPMGSTASQIQEASYFDRKVAQARLPRRVGLCNAALAAPQHKHCNPSQVGQVALTQRTQCYVEYLFRKNGCSEIC
jgi:hypothetical protein